MGNNGFGVEWGLVNQSIEYFVKPSTNVFTCFTRWIWSKWPRNTISLSWSVMWIFCFLDHSEFFCCWRRSWRKMRGTEAATGVVSTVFTLFAVNVSYTVRHCWKSHRFKPHVLMNQCVFLLQSLSAAQTDARGGTLCPQQHGWPQ